MARIIYNPETQIISAPIEKEEEIVDLLDVFDEALVWVEKVTYNSDDYDASACFIKLGVNPNFLLDTVIGVVLMTIK